MPYIALRRSAALVLLGSLCWLALPLGSARRALALHQADADDFRQRYADRQAEFAASLHELAAWCDQRGLLEQAAEARALALPPDASGVVFYLLPREVQPAVPDGADGHLAVYHRRLHEQRANFAQDLFQLARSAFDAGHGVLAYDLVVETTRLDPDHRAARSLLGYQRYRDQWVTPYEAAQLRQGHVWHERFGWLPRAWVERYESGMRRAGNRWITADEEAALRSDIADGWEVRTDHFVVRTNHSLERGVELAQKLEGLYQIFYRLFVGSFTPREQLANLFEGRGTAAALRRARPLQVVYFRDRSEYNQTLRPVMGDAIEITHGIYVGDHRTAYFFEDAELGDDWSLYHEATHQLFTESRERTFDAGRDANFWIIEGIACYMESLAVQGDRLEVGGTDAVRLSDARFRALENRFYVPLAEFVLLGRESFQRSPQIALLYSQAAGLTHFLMHYDNARYREALVDYLEAVYTAHDTPRTLAELTGEPYETLDEQYHEFLRALQP